MRPAGTGPNRKRLGIHRQLLYAKAEKYGIVGEVSQSDRRLS